MWPHRTEEILQRGRSDLCKKVTLINERGGTPVAGSSHSADSQALICSRFYPVNDFSYSDEMLLFTTAFK